MEKGKPSSASGRPKALRRPVVGATTTTAASTSTTAAASQPDSAANKAAPATSKPGLPAAAKVRRPASTVGAATTTAASSGISRVSTSPTPASSTRHVDPSTTSGPSAAAKPRTSTTIGAASKKQASPPLSNTTSKIGRSSTPTRQRPPPPPQSASELPKSSITTSKGSPSKPQSNLASRAGSTRGGSVRTSAPPSVALSSRTSGTPTNPTVSSATSYDVANSPQKNLPGDDDLDEPTTENDMPNNRQEPNTPTKRSGAAAVGATLDSSSTKSSPRSGGTNISGSFPPASAYFPPGVGMCGTTLLLDRYVVIVGGLDSATNQPLNSIQVFDLQMNCFLQHTPDSLKMLPIPLYGHSCVCSGSTVWCVGGATARGQAVRSLISFKIKLLARFGGKPMDLEIKDISATELDVAVIMASVPLLETAKHSPLALVIGGITQDDSTTVAASMTNRVFAVDLDEMLVHRITQVGDVPPPHAAAACTVAHTKDIQRVILFGGRTTNGQLLHDVFVAELRVDHNFDSYTFVWKRYSQDSSAQTWPTARFGHSLTRFGARFYLLTGHAPQQPPQSILEKLQEGATMARTTSSILTNDGDNTSTAASDAGSTLSNGKQAVTLLREWAKSHIGPYILSFDPESGCSWSEVDINDADPFRSYHAAYWYEPAAPATPTTTDVVVSGTTSKNSHGSSSTVPTTIGPSLFFFGGSSAVCSMSAKSDGSPQTQDLTMQPPFIGRSATEGLESQFRNQGAALRRGAGGSGSVAAGSGFAGSSTSSLLKHFKMPAEVTFRLHFKDDHSSAAVDADGTPVHDEITIAGNDLTVESLRGEVLKLMKERKAHIQFSSEDDVLLEFKAVVGGDMRPLHMEFLLKEAIASYSGGPIPVTVLIDEPPHHYTLYTKLGSGSFGTVFTALNKKQGGFFAVKVVDNINDERKLKTIKTEISMMRQLSHPNIVRYLGSEIEGTTVYIFMEYVAGAGTVEEFCHRCRIQKMLVPIRQVQMYTRQVLSALVFLHSFNIVHRDIKGANVLLQSEGTIKLSDFGTAKHLTATNKANQQVAGTYLFMAPEAIDTSKYPLSTVADIWSLGCLVVQMTTGDYPYREKNFDNEGQICFWVGGGNPPAIPKRLPPSGRDFLDRCFKVNPNERATAKELLHHPFVTELVDVDADDEPNSANTSNTPSPSAAQGKKNKNKSGDIPASPPRHAHHDDTLHTEYSSAGGEYLAAGGTAALLRGTEGNSPSPARRESPPPPKSISTGRPTKLRVHRSSAK